MESGRHSIIRKYIASAEWVPCQKESKATISESSHVSDPSFRKICIYVYDYAAKITHWTDHPAHQKVLILGEN